MTKMILRQLRIALTKTIRRRRRSVVLACCMAFAVPQADTVDSAQVLKDLREPIFERGSWTVLPADARDIPRLSRGIDAGLQLASRPPGLWTYIHAPEFVQGGEVLLYNALFMAMSQLGALEETPAKRIVRLRDCQQLIIRMARNPLTREYYYRDPDGNTQTGKRFISQTVSQSHLGSVRMLLARQGGLEAADWMLVAGPVVDTDQSHIMVANGEVFVAAKGLRAVEIPVELSGGGVTLLGTNRKSRVRVPGRKTAGAKTVSKGFAGDVFIATSELDRPGLYHVLIDKVGQVVTLYERPLRPEVPADVKSPGPPPVKP